MEKISLFIGLTRWKDWIPNILFVIFGFLLSLKTFVIYPSMVFVLVIFFLVQSFGFAINDYFDAPFDKLKESTHNVISHGLIKKQEAAVFCVALAVCGMSLSLLLPFQSFLVVVFLYFVFFAYSSPPFRLKEKLFFDITAHGFFTPLLLLASYAPIAPIDLKILLIAVAAFASSVIVCITQEVRDLKFDKKSGFRTTADFLGYKRSVNLVRFLMVSGVAVSSIAIVLFMPIYFMLLMVSTIFSLKYLFGKPLQNEFFKKSIESWNRGIIILVVVVVLLLPFYIGWIKLG